MAKVRKFPSFSILDELGGGTVDSLLFEKCTLGRCNTGGERNFSSSVAETWSFLSLWLLTFSFSRQPSKPSIALSSSISQRNSQKKKEFRDLAAPHFPQRNIYCTLNLARRNLLRSYWSRLLKKTELIFYHPHPPSRAQCCLRSTPPPAPPGIPPSWWSTAWPPWSGRTSQSWRSTRWRRSRCGPGRTAG